MTVNMKELGTQGAELSGGYSFAEWNNKLKGTDAIRTYREMVDSDPIIGAIILVIGYMLSNQPWHLDVGKGKDAEKCKEFVRTNMHGMEHTWEDFVLDALTMLQYGWSWHEICYKRDEKGQLVWEKLPIRSQTTLDHWKTDEKNNVIGFVQNDPYTPAGGYVTIPEVKSLHFKTTNNNGNPEGKSILRSAVRPYKFLARLQEVEAVGIERELAGLPVLQVPPKHLDRNATADIKANLANWKKVLMSIRRDEREGIILPSEFDEKGTATGYKFSLLKGGGTRAIDTDKVIQRYEMRIATTMLAQFILMGSQGSGSFAVADTQQGVFTIALQAALNRIAAEINRKLIPQLCDLNGWAKEDRPLIRAEKLQDVSLSTLATYINQLVSTNVLQADEELEAHLRKVADLPVKGQPRQDPAIALLEKQAELAPEPTDSPVGPGPNGSNPTGAGKPKKKEGNARKDPNLKATDPKDTTGKDKVNVRTRTPKK